MNLIFKINLLSSLHFSGDSNIWIQNYLSNKDAIWFIRNQSGRVFCFLCRRFLVPFLLGLGGKTIVWNLWGLLLVWVGRIQLDGLMVWINRRQFPMWSKLHGSFLWVVNGSTVKEWDLYCSCGQTGHHLATGQVSSLPVAPPPQKKKRITGRNMFSFLCNVLLSSCHWGPNKLWLHKMHFVLVVWDFYISSVTGQKKNGEGMSINIRVEKL